MTNVAVVEHPTFCRKPLAQTQDMLIKWDSWINYAPRECSGFFILPGLAPVNVVFAASTDTNAVPQEKLKSKSVPCNKMLFGKNLITFADVPGLADLEKTTLGGSFRIGGKNLSIKDYHSGLQTYLEPHQQPGHYYEAAFLLKEMTAEVAEVLARATKNDAPNSNCSVIIFAFGGKVTEIADDATALESRAFKYWIIIEGGWKYSADKATNDQKRQAVKEWSAKLRTDLAPMGLKESPHVFEGEEDEGVGRKAFTDTNIDRLIELKKKYDPENVFSFNKVSCENDLFLFLRVFLFLTRSIQPKFVAGAQQE